jgi:hypothetical protein
LCWRLIRGRISELLPGIAAFHCLLSPPAGSPVPSSLGTSSPSSAQKDGSSTAMPNVLQGTWAIPPSVARSSAACLRRRGPEVHATKQSHADPRPFAPRWPPALGRLPRRLRFPIQCSRQARQDRQDVSGSPHSMEVPDFRPSSCRRPQSAHHVFELFASFARTRLFFFPDNRASCKTPVGVVARE